MKADATWGRCAGSKKKAISSYSKDVLEILVLCKFGRRRSDAVAACLQWALTADARVGVTRSWDISAALC